LKIWEGGLDECYVPRLANVGHRPYTLEHGLHLTA